MDVTSVDMQHKTDTMRLLACVYNKASSVVAMMLLLFAWKRYQKTVHHLEARIKRTEVGIILKGSSLVEQALLRVDRS